MVDTFYYYFISDWSGSRLNDTLDHLIDKTSIHVNAPPNKMIGVHYIIDEK